MKPKEFIKQLTGFDINDVDIIGTSDSKYTLFYIMEEYAKQKPKRRTKRKTK